MKTAFLPGLFLLSFLACESAPESQHVVIPHASATPVNYQDPKLPKTSTKPDWPGTYANEFGKTLKIKSAPHDGTLEFELIQNSPDCIESFKGGAIMITGATAKFKRDLVELTFTWKSGTIEVADLGFAHESGCESFNGVYKKQ